MSVLPNNTLANPYVSFYAPLGGGGSASSLQSPASVIPDAALGDCELTMTASALGDSRLTIAGGPGNSGNLSIQGQESYISLQQIKLFASSAATHTMVINASADGTDVPLAGFDYTNDVITLGKPLFGGSITLNSATTVAEPLSVTSGANTSFTTNPATNITTIGNPLSAGAVYLNNTTTVTNSGSRPPVGGITLEQTSPTNSQIAQQTAQGTLQIGSSTTFPNTLIISDVPYLGAGNYVEVRGGAGLAPLFLSGAQGAAGQCGIHPDAAPGSGQLLLGADNTNNANITLNGSNTRIGSGAVGATNTITADTTFTTGNCIIQGVLGFNFTGGSGAQCGAIEGMNSYTSSTVTVGDNSTGSIPNPTDSLGGAIEVGLYFILGRNSTANNVPWQSVSTIGYWTGTAWVGGGGCCPALVSAPPSFLGIQGGGATLTLANGSGLGAASMIFYFRQIGGLLGMS